MKQSGMKSRPAQRRINIKYARRKLAALLAANFQAGDLLVTLRFNTFRGKAGRSFMTHCLRWWVKEMRRDYDKAGATFRYIYALDTGHQDGSCALAVVNQAGLSSTAYSWQYGRVTVEPLDTFKDWDALADRLMRETLAHMEKPVPNEWAYHAANGLQHGPE